MFATHFHSLTNISLKCSGSLSSAGGRTSLSLTATAAIEIRSHRHAVAKIYLAIDQSRRPLCLMSRVSRALAQPFLTAQPIESHCHAIAKIYPIDRCRVPITLIATILLPPTNGALGHLPTHKATGRNSLLAMLTGETRPDGK